MDGAKKERNPPSWGEATLLGCSFKQIYGMCSLFLVGFLNFDPLHEQDGEWGFTRAQQGFFEGFRLPGKVYILKDGMRGGCLLHQRMILWWSCFFTSNKKTWVEKKKHAAFGEVFWSQQTESRLSSFLLIRPKWSSIGLPIPHPSLSFNTAGVRCCVAMHFFLRKAEIMSSESGCGW